jgi:hypothetical protein
MLILKEQRLGPVQQVIPQVQQLPIQLPLWVEYIKALGTPVVALVAASIAGVIAYRQWLTARNKLKLEFFDRRMEIYKSAIELVKQIADPEPSDWDDVSELARELGAAPWLLSPKVADHLEQLVHRGYQSIAKEKLNAEGMTEEQKNTYAFKAIAQAKQIMDKELRVLNELFQPYLAVEH